MNSCPAICGFDVFLRREFPVSLLAPRRQVSHQTRYQSRLFLCSLTFCWPGDESSHEIALMFAIEFLLPRRKCLLDALVFQFWRIFLRLWPLFAPSSSSQIDCDLGPPQQLQRIEFSRIFLTAHSVPSKFFQLISCMSLGLGCWLNFHSDVFVLYEAWINSSRLGKRQTSGADFNSSTINDWKLRPAHRSGRILLALGWHDFVSL